MAIKLKPLFDKIVLELNLESKSEGGILITALQPDDRVIKATVVAVGKGKRVNGVRQPIGLNPGDKVLCDKFAVQPQKVGDEVVFIGTPDCILGVLDATSTA